MKSCGNLFFLVDLIRNVVQHVPKNVNVAVYLLIGKDQAGSERLFFFIS